GIGHINAAGSVMHFALSNNFDARTLDPTRDVAAGVEVIDDSKPMATCTGAVTGTTDFPCVLPVSTSIELRHEGRRNLLTWMLPDPSVWQGQELEKYDDDSQQYMKLDGLPLGNACKADCEFEIADFWLKGDRSQYRLALTDLNGQIQYSDAVEVSHPHLAKGLSWTYERSAKQLICFLSFEESPQIKIQLIDLQGQKLAVDFERNGVGQWLANTHQLSSGVYLLKLIDPVSKIQMVEKIHILH
ncbi:MAG: T9SS type A sorting domain-containing protein, partial [Bacteroidia bacterium]